MSQIFRHSSNTFARTILFGAVFILGLAGWAVDRLSRSDYATRATQSREQPVPFSHVHHVGDLGMDCRYCHTTGETSSFANIPPTKTCMNCHSQIWSTSPTLEPVRASFRTHQWTHWPHHGGNVELRQHSAHQDVHELPLADLEHESHAGTGARQFPHQSIDSLDAGERSVRFRLFQSRHSCE